ncbi:MAG: hypothetical protein ACXACI_07810 [Candidatus Hodarchaeales archaeon]
MLPLPTESPAIVDMINDALLEQFICRQSFSLYLAVVTAFNAVLHYNITF